MTDPIQWDPLQWDGFQDAILGFAHRCGQDPLVVYSYPQLVHICVERDQMTEDEAREYIDTNLLGAWVGDGTPLILFPNEHLDDELLPTPVPR